MQALASLRLDSSHSSDCKPEERDASQESRAQPTAASAAELQEATQLWGIRLEVGGGFRQKPQKPSKDKRPGVREQFRQDSAGSEPHRWELLLHSLVKLILWTHTVMSPQCEMHEARCMMTSMCCPSPRKATQLTPMSMCSSLVHGSLKYQAMGCKLHSRVPGHTPAQ